VEEKLSYNHESEAMSSDLFGHLPRKSQNYGQLKSVTDRSQLESEKNEVLETFENHNKLTKPQRWLKLKIPIKKKNREGGPPAQ